MKRGIPTEVPYYEGGNLSEPYTLSTDSYVEEEKLTYLLQSDIIRIQGNPYTDVDNMKMVNPSRFNIVKLNVPDMNKTNFPPEMGKMKVSLGSKIKIWKVIGVRVDVQGPQQPAVTGHTQTLLDPTDQGEDTPSTTPTQTIDWGWEHKQVQYLAVGCEPLMGTYEVMTDPKKGSVVTRKQMKISDGQLHEFGYGFTDLLTDKEVSYRVPAEMIYTKQPTVIPDEISMNSDLAGNKMFFSWKREAAGIRHMMRDYGLKNPEQPTGTSGSNSKPLLPDPMCALTSGMTSNSLDIFNRNYWLWKARGPNNGVLWNNVCYVSFVDNTRGYIHQFSVTSSNDEELSESEILDRELGSSYSGNGDKNVVLRHIKEYRVSLLVRLCTVTLEAKLVTQLWQLNKQWLNQIGFNWEVPMQMQPTIRDIAVNELKCSENEEEREEDIDCVEIHVNGETQVHWGQTHQFEHHSLVKEFNSHIKPLMEKSESTDQVPKRGGARGGATGAKRAKV